MIVVEDLKRTFWAIPVESEEAGQDLVEALHRADVRQGRKHMEGRYCVTVVEEE